MDANNASWGRRSTRALYQGLDEESLEEGVKTYGINQRAIRRPFKLRTQEKYAGTPLLLAMNRIRDWDGTFSLND